MNIEELEAIWREGFRAPRSTIAVPNYTQEQEAWIESKTHLERIPSYISELSTLRSQVRALEGERDAAYEKGGEQERLRWQNVSADFNRCLEERAGMAMEIANLKAEVERLTKEWSERAFEYGEQRKIAEATEKELAETEAELSALRAKLEMAERERDEAKARAEWIQLNSAHARTWIQLSLENTDLLAERDSLRQRLEEAEGKIQVLQEQVNLLLP